MSCYSLNTATNQVAVSERPFLTFVFVEGFFFLLGLVFQFSSCFFSSFFKMSRAPQATPPETLLIGCPPLGLCRQFSWRQR